MSAATAGHIHTVRGESWVCNAEQCKCFSCGMDLNDPEAQPTHEVDDRVHKVCSYCWEDYMAECAHEKGEDSNV